MPGAVKEKKIDAASYRAHLYDSYRSNLGQCPSIDGRASRAPYLRRLLAKHFPPNRAVKILDLGCGNGTLISFLREAGYLNVSGVDTSLEQVAEAQRLNIAGIQHGDVLDALQTTGSETLDIVIAFDVIEHLTKPELLTLANEVCRVLKPQGRWVIHAPNAESPFGAYMRYVDWTHEQAFTKESLSQLLKATGFSYVRCYEDQPVVHGLKSLSRWLVWKLVRNVIRIYRVAETGTTGRDSVFSQNLLAIAVKE